MFWLLINIPNLFHNSVENHTVLQNFEALSVLTIGLFRMAKNRQFLENRFIEVPGREGKKEKVVLQRMTVKRFRDYK